MTPRPNESVRPEVETTTSPDAQRSPHRITRKKEQRSRIPRGVALVNTHTRPKRGEEVVRASNGCLTNRGEEDMGRRRGQKYGVSLGSHCNTCCSCISQDVPCTFDEVSRDKQMRNDQPGPTGKAEQPVLSKASRSKFQADSMQEMKLVASEGKKHHALLHRPTRPCTLSTVRREGQPKEE